MNDTEHTSPTGEKTGIDYLSELIRSATEGMGEEQATHTPPPRPAGDTISALLSDPNLLAKLPSLISAAGPIIELLSSSARKEGSPTSAPAAISVSAPQTTKRNEEHDRRTALLCAMKPYLSAERQAAVDHILKLSKLGDVLKTL